MGEFCRSSQRCLDNILSSYYIIGILYNINATKQHMLCIVKSNTSLQMLKDIVLLTAIIAILCNCGNDHSVLNFAEL